MPERGGTSTQSGILFQNSITALYLGRLLDPAQRKPSDRVIHVRAEAPSIVDDIVVTFADEHSEYIQAKESIGDAEWTSVWRDFLAQTRHASFRYGKDRLVLICGHEPTRVAEAAEACARAFSSSTLAEWIGRLSERGRGVVHDVAERSGLAVDTELLVLFQQVRIEVMSLRTIERDMTFFWIPQSSCGIAQLFALLRDKVGGHARTRLAFDRERLLRELTEEMPSFRIATVVPFAEIDLSVKRVTALLKQHKSTLGNTGIHCKRAIVGSIVEWMLTDAASGRVAMLLDQAGAGKTVVVADVASELQAAGHQVLALKADLQLADIAGAEEIQSRLQLPDTFERVVERMSANGPVFVLFDQIDALSLALAHNEQTLAVVLDVLARVVLIREVRVLLSCRTFDRNNDPRLRQFRTARDFAIAELDDEELRDILGAAGVDPLHISLPTRELIRVPLHMDLFLLTHGDGEAPATLQDLYRSLIHQVALQAAPGAPPRTARAGVLAKLTAYMHRRHRTSAPDKVVAAEEDLGAAEWLGSHGILLRTENGWTFRHQTMLEYLFADDFVERGSSLLQHLLASAQGLPQRTELLQILPHLRAERPSAFLAELSTICAARDVRFHLRDLALRWFAGLRNPTDDETAWVTTLLNSASVRRRFWLAARGNPIWFDQLRLHLEDASLHDDEMASEDVIAYVGSVAQERQTAAVEILKILAQARSTSTNAIAAVLRRIEWKEPRVIDLFALLAERGVPLPNERITISLIDLDPVRSVGWIATVAKRHLALGPRAVIEDVESIDGRPLRFVHIATSELGAALRRVSAIAAEQWLEVMFPVVDELLPGSDWDRPSEPKKDHETPSDSSVRLWRGLFDVKRLMRMKPQAVDAEAIVDSLTYALFCLKSPDEFRRWTTALGRSRSACLQDKLASALFARLTLRSIPFALSPTSTGRRFSISSVSSEEIVKLAMDFVCSTHRRISGEAGGLFALVEYLVQDPATNRRVVEVLHAEITGQANLSEATRSMWAEVLTTDPEWIRKRLPASKHKEKKRKLSTKLSGKTHTLISTVVGVETAGLDHVETKPMTLQQWRRTLKRRRMSAPEATKLIPRLRTEVATNPQWFIRTFAKAPSPVSRLFVQALFQGLQQASVPLSDVQPFIANLLPSPIPAGVPCAVAWWLWHTESIPDDLLDLLERWARDPALEATQLRVSRAYYLAHDRGAPFLVLMRALRTQRGREGSSRREELFEYAASEGTTVLKAAAIEELIHELPESPKKALDWLDRFFLDDDPHLLGAARLVPLLEAALRHSFSRVSRYIVDLYDAADTAEFRMRGAQLLAHAALSSCSSTAMDVVVARRLFESALENGRAEHKEAATRVLTAAIDRGPTGDYCVAVLRKLLDDPDPRIHAAVRQSFAQFGRWDLSNRQEFFFAYARSRALVEGIGSFATLLLDHGLTLPDLALSLIETMLANEHLMTAPRIYNGKELIQFVIRIELFPASSNGQRRRAMDVFDALMEYYADVAGDVLADWDRQ